MEAYNSSIRLNSQTFWYSSSAVALSAFNPITDPVEQEMPGDDVTKKVGVRS